MYIAPGLWPRNGKLLKIEDPCGKGDTQRKLEGVYQRIPRTSNMITGHVNYISVIYYAVQAISNSKWK